MPALSCLVLVCSQDSHIGIQTIWNWVVQCGWYITCKCCWDMLDLELKSGLQVLGCSLIKSMHKTNVELHIFVFLHLELVPSCLNLSWAFPSFPICVSCWHILYFIYCRFTSFFRCTWINYNGFRIILHMVISNMRFYIICTDLS